MFKHFADRRHQRVAFVAFGWLGCSLIGCGGGSAPPATVTPIPAMKPVQPVATEPSRPDPVAAAQAAAKNQAALAPQSAMGKTADPFADEDPGNLFEITESGPKYEVPAAGPVSETDLFVGEAVVPDSDSSQFEVQASSTAGAGPAPDSARDAGMELPEGFSAVASFGFSSVGLPLRIRGEKTNAMMALVTGGLARIGSVDGPDETQPVFTPFLDAFYMDVTEVTLGEYERFREDIKQKKSSRVQPPINEGQDVNLPALGLPWGVAQGFAHWSGKELPTEAEWEKAARGPEGFRAPWGDGRAVWSKPRTPDMIAPVAAFRTDQSVYGIYDLAGNAREWCSDWYSDTAHQLASHAPERALHNWPGPKKASVSGQRVVKGNGPDWLAWHREGRAMSDRAADIGFRCVLRIKPSATTDAKGD